MLSKQASLLLAAALCTCAPGALAQEDPLEGHSGHGESFNEGPRQAAYLMDNPGSVHFPVTVTEPRLQAFFDQGVGQLHGFWYLEAERSFRQIAAEDPDCAMAYWGMAMANLENEERAKGFARVAWLKRGLVTERERMYVDAIARYYGVEGPAELEDADEGAAEEDAEPALWSEAPEDLPETRAEKEEREKRDREEREERKKRGERLVQDYEELIRAYPDDIEAKAFLANRLWLNRRAGLTISSRQANDALLQQVFAAQPMHPAHHYRIHLWDAEDTADYVVDSAVKSGPSWPGIAHMWHMGGHIFARLGRHSDAAWQQEASARVDHAHMMRDRVMPDQIHNFAHNNEWLTRSLRHHGRVAEAVDLAKNMIELPRHPEYNRLDKRGCSASLGRERLLEVLELFEQWEPLIELSETMYLEPSDEAVDGALRAFALGKAFAHLDNEYGFEEQVATLQAMLDRSKRERAVALDEAEEAALGADYEAADVRKAMEDVLSDFEGELKDVRDKLDFLAALRAVLRHDDVEENLTLLADRGFDKAHLSRLYLDAGQRLEKTELVDKAVELAREAVDKRDGQLLYHANLAYVLHAAGEEEEALDTFDALREWTARADLDLPVFQRLAPLVELRDLPADWRVPARTAEDVGERIDLATLGPLRWSPPRALPWSAEDAYGETYELADYEGRPVLVIFFLGFECVHCVEQLHAFAPVNDRYEDAGIDIVTIGTQSREQLFDALGSDPQDTGYPFPILADPDFDLFKRYRAYDDFEGEPLHGTFLIDGRGRVRWQDISYEPFMDWEFLLDESQRLLGLPAAPSASPQTAAAREPDAEDAAGSE